MAFARGALLVLGVVVLAAAAAAAAEGGGSVCFDRVFSFGDSLTDTGNFLLSVPEDFPDPARYLPYGQTFFGRPSGRYSDGRNLLDFFAEAFGMPYVPPYLGGGDFRHGANFAVGGATALSWSFFRERGVEPTWTPHSLDEQLQWFKKLLPSIAPSEPGLAINDEKTCDWWLCATVACSQRLSDAVDLRKQNSPDISDTAKYTLNLPRTIRQTVKSTKLLCSCAERSDVMSKSLFFAGEIGGNDYNHLIVRGKSLDELHELVPHVVGAISSAITNLINLGAKKLVVPGNFPIGCVPLYLAIFPSQKEDYYDEQTGCINWLNEFAEHHNKMIQEELEKLRNLYPDVTIIYADYYGATLDIFRAPLKFGFTVPRNACCGSDAPHNCSLSIMCGNPGSSVCPDPSKYISWDGLHFTEASYKVVIQGVLGGYATPPLSEICKGGEYKVSQLHQCTDNPTNTVTYDALSSFI
ncbi:hypothetical protein EJB05_17873 [Eragrostis curvula]|uniref:GDSL esterase/lipase n=1 Tax=Eragrostis curvula TaxID=38414 RepID=A0A5J9VKK1_9POAL|nr:hypothetical protein EJB05_17873 [Eragrostis curvula]